MKLSMARVSVSSCRRQTFFENFLAGDDFRPSLAHQVAQQFGFHQREVNDVVGGAQLEHAKVDGLAV
jgi:hypothetical protein